MRSVTVQLNECSSFPAVCLFYLWNCIIIREKNEWFWVWVTLSQCFTYPMMRNWHQCMGTQPRVAAACDGYQLRLFTCMHICQHTHTAGPQTAMYGFDPDPTQLNAAPSDSAGRVVLVIHRRHMNRYSGFFVYLWCITATVWFNLKSTAVCVFLLYCGFLWLRN